MSSGSGVSAVILAPAARLRSIAPGCRGLLMVPVLGLCGTIPAGYDVGRFPFHLEPLSYIMRTGNMFTC